MARNKLAGKHKSYDDRGMTEKAISNKRKADKEINERPEQIKKRVEANKARRNAKKEALMREVISKKKIQLTYIQLT